LRRRNCAFRRRFSGHFRAFFQGARKCLSTKGFASLTRRMFQTSEEPGGASPETTLATTKNVGGALRAAMRDRAGPGPAPSCLFHLV
jgi:hypothetical protein